MTPTNKIPVKSWRIPEGDHADLLKALAALKVAIETVLEDWYPELAGANWDISSGGVVTIWGEVESE